MLALVHEVCHDEAHFSVRLPKQRKYTVPNYGTLVGKNWPNKLYFRVEVMFRHCTDGHCDRTLKEVSVHDFLFGFIC